MILSILNIIHSVNLVWRYYSQTDAYIPGCIFYHEMSECLATDVPDYRAFVGAINNPERVISYNYLGYSIVNSGDVLYGIDCFAWACRHESKHHTDYSSWWGPSGVDPELDRDENVGDYIPDEMEPDFPISQGGPYSTLTRTTHPVEKVGGNDDQAECVFTQGYWAPGSGDGLDQDGNNNPSEQCIDWAYPGSRWK